MKNILFPLTNNIVIHFPINDKDKKNKLSPGFEKIYTTLPFSILENFSFLKNVSKTELIENRINLNMVIKRNSISLEMEILIAGKAFSEFKDGEIAYYYKKEDYYFHEITLLELNLDIKFNKVKKGKYPISISDDKILILFILRKGN
jgi:hypothetical protein